MAGCFGLVLVLPLGPSREHYPFWLGLQGFAPLAEREKSVPLAASSAAILDWGWGSLPCGSPEATGLLPGGLQNARPTAPRRLFRLLVLSRVPLTTNFTANPITSPPHHLVNFNTSITSITFTTTASTTCTKPITPSTLFIFIFSNIAFHSTNAKGRVFELGRM